MKRGASVQRSGNRRRRERSRILIVTEGEETEIQYLQGIAQHLRATGAQVAAMRTRGIGRDPLRVVRAGLDLHEKADSEYDAVWVVVDVDDHATLDEAIHLALQRGVSIVVSNPCFEVWLLWHFDDCTGYVSSQDLRRRLAQHGLIGKHLPPRFPYARVDDAIRRSAAQSPGVRGPNPSSAMASLVTALQVP